MFSPALLGTIWVFPLIDSLEDLVEVIILEDLVVDHRVLGVLTEDHRLGGDVAYHISQL